MIRRLFLIVVAGIALLNAVVVASYAAPAPFFAYGVSHAGMTLRSDRPLDAGMARVRLAAVAETLEATGIGPLPEGLAFHAAHDGWRERLFFLSVPGAGGVVYAPISHRNAFLVAIDPRANRISKNGHVITPPRTLEYYMIHEAAHLMTAARVGTLRFHLMPHWVREGTADYVALGPMAPDLAAALLAAGRERATLDEMRAHGAYPIARAKVTAALARRGCDLTGLLDGGYTAEVCQWH